MSSIEELKNKINTINSEITNSTNYKRELEKQLKNELRNQCTVIYAIEATPSDTRHIKHTACFFSTFDKANDALPNNNTSYDDDDNVTWFYTIKKITGDDLSNYNLLHLDVKPHYYPYYGW